MNEELKNLPRLGEDAMGPCAMCGTQLLGTGLPLFYRLEAQRCGIDAKEVQRHVGLAMTMGGGRGGLALASVMGPGVKPVVVMAKPAPFNVCTQCAQNNPLETIFLVAAERLETKGEAA
jgi:hypothetical protein